MADKLEIKLPEGGGLIDLEQTIQCGNAVCMIARGDGARGSGFYIKTKLFGGGVEYRFIVTNNHVIKSEKEASVATAIFHFKGEKSGTPVKLRPNILFFTNKGLDYSIIGVDEEQLSRMYPPISPIEYSEQPQAKSGDQICIIQHALGRPKQFSCKNIVDVQYPFVHYDVDTEDGSSGSPVLRNLKLIAIHKCGNEKKGYNKGILFSAVINDIKSGCRFRDFSGEQYRNDSYSLLEVGNFPVDHATLKEVSHTNSHAVGQNFAVGHADNTMRYTLSLQDQPTLPAVHAPTNTPPRNRTAQHRTANNENEVTTKEVVMKNTYDELEKYFGQGKVEMERTRNGDINMIFEHESYHWMLRFPDTFPDQPAKLFRASRRHHLSCTAPCSDFLLEKPLTNRVNILLSIKKNCLSSCNVCKSITKGKLTMPVTAAVAPENAKLANVLQELTTEIPFTLSTPLSSAVKAKVDGSYRIEFEHYMSKWSVEIPAEFPEKPAEVYKKEGTYGTSQKKTINELSSGRHKEKPLISSDDIMSAIRRNCFCSQCYRVH